MMGCGASSSTAVHPSKQVDQYNFSQNAQPFKGYPRVKNESISGLHRLPTASINTVLPNSDALQQFVEIENQIYDLEKRFPVETFHVKNEQIDQLEQSMLHLAATRDNLAVECEKLRNELGLDVHSTEDFVMLMFGGRANNNNYDEDMDPTTSKEQEKLLDLLSRQEIVDREMSVIMQHRDAIRKDMDSMKKKGDRMNELHSKRDEILDAIFEKQYGSELEQKIEKDLDWLVDQKHHVQQASFRWTQALTLTDMAFNQISKGLQKWKEITPATDLKRRYHCATEARNLFLNGSQNIFASLHYLPNIEVPYCRPDEMLVLDKAIAFVYLDMMSEERHSHAATCYQTCLKRIGALKQWLNTVICTTINKDLSEVLENSRSLANDLRNERIKQIKFRLKELLGRDSQDLIQDTPIDVRDSGFDSELEGSIGTDELRRLFSSERSSSTPDPTPRPLIMPTPVPSADLAPMPSTDEIFGKIEVIRRRHREDFSEFTRSQKLAQARITQGLNDKLNQRRSRRSRMEMHSRQQEALYALKED